MDSNDISKHHCTSCVSQARDVLFSCVECDDINLCFQCFMNGVEFGSHKRDHEVKIIDLGTFPIFNSPNADSMDIDDGGGLADDENESIEQDDKVFRKFLYDELGREFTENFVVNDSDQTKPYTEEYEWRAMDEKALFEALVRVGFGNWKDIANYINTTVGTNLSPPDVGKHYCNHYTDGLIGRLCWTWIFTDPVARQLSRFPFTVRGHYDKIPVNKDNCSDLFSDIPQSELDSLGYLPKRDDFEREFDNEAETLISNLTLGAENEDDIEKKFKLAQIDIYQRRLISRFRKKLIIRVNELIKLFLEVHKNELFKESLQGRRDSNHKLFKDFAEKYPMFMPFVRYLRKQDLNNLFEDIAMEQVLKILLKKFILFSCLSTPNLEGLTIEDRVKLLKDCNESVKKIEERVNKNTENRIEGSKLKLSRSDSLDEIIECLEDIEDLDEGDIMEIIFADEDPIDRECLNHVLDHEPMSTLSRMTAEFLTKHQTPDSEEFLKDAIKFLREHQILNSTTKEEITLESPAKKMKTGDSVSNNDPASPASTATVSSTDLAELDGQTISNNYVTDSERKLCNELKIEPNLYAQFKTALIKQHKKYPKAARHRLNLENILNKLSFGKEKLEPLKRVYNHLLTVGVLSIPHNQID